jgi:exonuclease I
VWDVAESYWPILKRPVEADPVDGLFAFSLGGLVTELNDVHGWTREAIADFVATIEAAQDAPVEQPALVEA